ncbi:MAG: dihydroorotase [Candidatus Latescibacteria bacterium]|nr:dihydroorotase [Candidatus Latescibacterota bacterium]
MDWIERCLDDRGGNFWIDGARLIDPVAGTETKGAVHVEGGRIRAIAAKAPAAGGVPVLDAGGLCLAPGLVDMHVHLREPGFEDKETVATGSASAARGGVTAMACMPNTKPICDDAAIVELIRERAATAGLCRVHPIGAITQGAASEQLADMGEMLAAGAIGFSDDGWPVRSAGLLRNALELSLRWDALLISHAEEPSLSQGGVMNESAVSHRLGLKGIPREAEDIGTDRDVRLAGLTGARLHIAHVSSRNSVEIVRRAKADGLRVTAETAPHYLLLDDTALEGYDSHKKMNPPLREKSDQEALVAALVDGTLDCVATDHAPHTEAEKQRELAYAPFGVTGLETSLAAVLTRLVHTGLMKLPAALALLTSRPAAILGLDGGRLEAGAPADLVLFDPEEAWTVRGAEMASKGRNTAFEGMSLTGRVRATVLGGQVVYAREGEAERFSPRPWRAVASHA